MGNCYTDYYPRASPTDLWRKHGICHMMINDAESIQCKIIISRNLAKAWTSPHGHTCYWVHALPADIIKQLLIRNFNFRSDTWILSVQSFNVPGNTLITRKSVSSVVKNMYLLWCNKTNKQLLFIHAMIIYQSSIPWRKKNYDSNWNKAFPSKVFTYKLCQVTDTVLIT